MMILFLVLIGSLAALIGLWITVCRLDRKTRMPHIAAALLMMFGTLSILGWVLGSLAITSQWLMHGMAALLFGLGMWLAFDRRHP
jgi:uncharacterized membrane protein YiaA